uniref:Sodium-coupled monocarboxylate transporter 1 n=1 Tax=Ciona savignyi TaxID=51511 RepID=H2YIT7_CIOSA
AVPTELSTADYAVFGVTLGFSAAIGIFYAIKDWRSREGTEEYLLGGRNLGMIPVSLSLSVSFMSAVTVLGTPAEVYIYGTMYWWFLLAMLIVAVVTSELYIPMFYKMGISSTYEYLEKRFNRPVRILATVTFILETIFYVGIVIYAPSLALSAVTGFDLWTAVMSTGIVCTFYTTLGGIKAVIWTDVFQAVVMLCGFLAVTIRGSIVLGGYEKVWQICEEGGRIDFLHFDLDPRYRHTFWSIIVGGTFLWLGVYAVSQSQVQRYLCCRSVKQAKGAIYLNWLGLVVIISLSVINGTILYAFYHDCDPLGTGKVGATDQLLPYMALELFKDYPGVTGLVVSCIFSGSLSTVSSGINAMSCVTVEDFIKPVTKWSDTTYTWVSKGSVIIYGGLCIAMAYLASQLGGVLEAALSILGLVGGPLGNKTVYICVGKIFGAFVGLLSGLAVSIWVYVGSKTYPPAADNATVPSTIALNMSTAMMTTTVAPEIPAIADFYSISYVYYSCIGVGTTLVIGLLLSLLT